MFSSEVNHKEPPGETEELQEGIWLHEYDTSSPLMRDVPVERVSWHKGRNDMENAIDWKDRTVLNSSKFLPDLPRTLGPTSTVSGCARCWHHFWRVDQSTFQESNRRFMARFLSAKARSMRWRPLAVAMVPDSMGTRSCWKGRTTMSSLAMRLDYLDQPWYDPPPRYPKSIHWGELLAGGTQDISGLFLVPKNNVELFWTSEEQIWEQ